jgi:hypothetical protein
MLVVSLSNGLIGLKNIVMVFIVEHRSFKLTIGSVIKYEISLLLVVT